MKTIYKHTITIILFVFTVGVFSSCEDFLEKSPVGQLTQETFPVTADDALLATNACYSTLRVASYHSGMFPLADIMSDDARKGSNVGDQATTIGPYDSFTFTTTGDELASWWATLYEGVKNTNVVIEKVPSIEMDITLRNRYIGEAKFLRALYYFDMVKAWGGVPLITSTTSALNVARTDVETVYQLIVSDLEFAISNLNEK
ncbi:MAG TPA: RagB/SusD family nutrient uptake outer membrane protein, partial [Marinilabiliales bacterium]|nr:RagB/SusD family nutrient uptake outer membrane protein [Marinilabiliales bacterium]